MKIPRSTLSIAAEFAVASELGRRGIYAQPTLGLQKRTDLLIFAEDGKLLRLEVKGKQSSQWPNCKGIFGDNVVMVLVDFAGKTEQERPDFYVLSERDWLEFLHLEIDKRPEKKIIIDEHNVPIWTTQIKNGQPYRGIGVTVKDVAVHKEKWQKIFEAMK